jgi:hypothetical protein
MRSAEIFNLVFDVGAFEASRFHFLEDLEVLQWNSPGTTPAFVKSGEKPWLSRPAATFLAIFKPFAFQNYSLAYPEFF